MLSKYCKLAEKLKLDLVDVELEVRFRIPKIEIESFKSYTITYYRSAEYPHMIFRSYNDRDIESKEIIEKTNYRNTNLVLSIEQKNVELNLVKNGVIRKIKRAILQKDPLVEVICENNEYTMEIEFDSSNVHEVPLLINKYKCKWWPAPKPMEISLLSLSRKLSKNLEKFVFSHKADGLHFMIFDDIILYDNGNACIPENPLNVFEGEMVEGNKMIFDCLVYQGNNVSRWPYQKRWELISPEFRKPIWIFNNLEELRSWCYMPPQFKSDGHIITNNRKIYKSKWVSTIDLRFKNGYLFLENQVESDLRCNLNLEENSINEFIGETLEFLKPRPDKNKANYKWVGESNQLYKFSYGINIPSVRVAHNKLKLKMLETLPKTTLLDIGSGKGGDFDKWMHLKFQRIYALDPKLELRKHSWCVTEIRESTKSLKVELDYDSISIFFVPWDDSFLKYILKAKYFAISYMVPPEEESNDVYSIKRKDNNVIINIPGTSTAEHIVEPIVDYQEIFKTYLSDWEIKEFKTDIYKECIEANLILYYKHFVFSKKE